MVAPEIGFWPPLTRPESAAPVTGETEIADAPHPKNAEQTAMPNPTGESANTKG